MKTLVHGRLSRRWLAALALGTLGFALNGFGLQVFGTSEIVFGGGATLLVTYCLGPWFGAFATALAFSRTWLGWGHPVGLLCFTLEAFVVGWLQHRRGRSPLAAAAIFWGLIGLPLGLLAMLRQHEIPFPNNWADALLFPFNSVLMALWVLPVFYSRRFRTMTGLPLDREADTPLERVLFRRLGLIIIPCIATLGLFAGRALDQAMRNFARTELVADGRELAELLQHHLDHQQRALFLVAGANASNTPGNDRLGPRLELLRNLYPGFLRLRAADLQGRVVAVTPTLSGEGSGHDARGFYGVAARQPMPLDAPAVSDIAASGPDGRDLVVALSAPLLDATGQRVGVIEGLVDLNDLPADIGGAGQLEGRSIVIVDRDRRVVAGRGRVTPVPLASFSGEPFYFAAHESTDGLFIYDDDSRNGRERFIATRDTVPNYGWQLFLAEPAWDTQRVIAGYYGATLVGAIAATLLALLLARGTAGEITRPLAQLADAIRGLTLIRDAQEPAALDIPHASRELTELSRDLHGATLTLSRSNRELAGAIADRDQTHENLRGVLLHLEDLVRERTLELDVARQAAESASQAKTEFLASMSHELRTPLSVIVGMSELMVEQTLGPLTPRQTEGLQNVNESGRHLLDLINDILDLSKIEAGQLQLDFQPMEIATVCATSVRFVREAARRKDIRVETDVPPGLAPILADERRVKQILVNLLANAVKFTPIGGRIGLEAEVDPVAGTVRFAVWDTGIGIAPENFERIFQPFQQIDSSLSRQYAGTGLGLALVRRMVRLHGGTVDVESETGSGSRFSILLPWLPENPAAVPAGVPADASAFPVTTHPLRVLVAEDNEANRQVYAAYFVTRPCEVTYAANGREAVDLALADRPDVVLMDVHMPVLDGLAAIRLLRADPRTEELPIIAVTALAMPEDRLRCLEAGASAYLSKPMNLRELNRALARFTPARCSTPLEPVPTP